MPKRLTAVSRKLRRDSTNVERQLWNRQLEGAKFRLQSAIGDHVADFACAGARLVIELDGGQHGERAEADALRTRALEASGYRVLRFWNGMWWRTSTAC